MSLDCTTVRERLADGEHEALEVTDHLSDCATCRAMQRSLEEIDLGLASLGPIEPDSALVERTLAQIDALRPEVAPAESANRVGLLAILGAVLGSVRRGLLAILALLVAPFVAVGRGVASMRGRKTSPGLRWARMAGVVTTLLCLAAVGGFAGLSSSPSMRQQASPEATSLIFADQEHAGAPAPGVRSGPNHAAQPSIATGLDDGIWMHEGRDRALARPPATPGAATPLGWDGRRGEQPDGDERPTNGADLGRFYQDLPPNDSTVSRLIKMVPRRDFLYAQRASVEGLSFQEPRGYWANTYVPGDPALRSVYGRLLATRGELLTSDGRSGLALVEQITTTPQPFDPPSRAALGLYVHADRTSVEGKNRVLLQVGLRAAARSAGQRPALGVAIVLDLRQPFTAETWARVQSLLESASRERQPDDRFGVFAAGPHGGVVIAQGTLRYGEIAVAMQRLRAGAESGPSERPAVDLESALRSALASLATPAASAAPTGTGLVWIVTPGLAPGDASLERVAHVGALGGIATSVLTIGNAGDASTLDSIVLAGQGRRRAIVATTDADQVVRTELEAGGRIVARAVRLRIRLAPGVQLVDILGSHRLDADAAERVREAERAADVQLARELGITQDRGEDEDGAQIVIPTFYADDAHVILLDLVVPGPGPVADVSARYKDLVRLRNATANESLSLDSGTRARGALERNVIENFVAHELAATLDAASQRAAAGAGVDAAALLRAFATSVQALGRVYPEVSANARIDADAALALSLARLVDESAARGRAPLVADTLRYAGYRRLTRPALAQSP